MKYVQLRTEKVSPVLAGMPTDDDDDDDEEENDKTMMSRRIFFLLLTFLKKLDQ